MSYDTSAPAPGAPRIMVIDDSLVVRRVIEVSFARVGIPTACFPDGLSALNALVKRETPVPDLLLLDIGLPKMDGYEVAKTLRQHPEMRDMIIVMLTGHDDVINRVKAALYGARDFIKKPFRPAELVARCCALLRIPAPSVTAGHF
jgi:DNA-binding response OmpR family regulator